MSNLIQHPADITCNQCGTNLQRQDRAHLSIVYSCQCGATTREVSKPLVYSNKSRIVRRMPSWNGPNNAA